MSLRSLIFHNFWLKLFSLALACLVWVFVKYRNKGDLDIRPTPLVNLSTQDSMRLPVAALTLPADARVFKIDPPNVYVTLTGEAALLKELSAQNIKAYVDLSEIRNEDSTYLVKVHAPPDITVRVLPKVVSVQQISP